MKKETQDQKRSERSRKPNRNQRLIRQNVYWEMIPEAAPDCEAWGHADYLENVHATRLVENQDSIVTTFYTFQDGEPNDEMPKHEWQFNDRSADFPGDEEVMEAVL